MQIRLAREFPIRHGLAVVADRAVFHRRGVVAMVQVHPLGGEIEQHLAHLGAGVAQRDAAVLDRLASRGEAFIGCLSGIAGDERDALRLDLELVGGDLLERGEDSLTKLNLAGADRDGAVGVDAYPGIEHPVVGEAARELRRLGGKSAGSEAEGEGERARALNEAAAGKDEAGHRAISRAARATARRMRTCVPQRQRLSAKAWRISVSLGCGFRARSPAALITMPLMQ